MCIKPGFSIVGNDSSVGNTGKYGQRDFKKVKM